MTPTFRWYRLETGDLTGATWSGPTEWLKENTPGGHGAIVERPEFASKWQARRVDSAGQVVAYQPSPPPDTADQAYRWDQRAERWVPFETLAAAKLRCSVLVNDKREKAFLARAVGSSSIPFTVAKDRENLAQQLQFRDLLQVPVSASTPWRDEDNVMHMLTRGQMVGLASDLAERMMRIHGRAWDLKKQIESAATFDQLQAIEIATGWD